MESRLQEGGWRNSRPPISVRVLRMRSRPADSSWRLPESPTAGSRPTTPGKPMPSSGGMGPGVATVKPTPSPFPGDGQSTVCCTSGDLHLAQHCAMPSLTPATVGGVLYPRHLTLRSTKDGPHQSVRVQKTARAPPVGPVGSRPPKVGLPLPWVPHAINQTRRGVATVIVCQVAAL